MATKRKSLRIALLIETSLGSGRRILEGVAHFARGRQGWELFHVPRGLEEPLPRGLAGWSGDAVIARIQTREMAEELAAIDLPVVDVLSLVDTPFPTVHVDDQQIAALAAGHLKSRGYQRFGFFHILGENWSERRMAHFQRACAEVGPVSCFGLGRELVGGRAGDLTELRRWVDGLPKPCGIMVCSDQRALLLIEACRAANIKIPEEIAVIGVDDDPVLCEICRPRLTSVRGGHYQVGVEACRLLERIIQDGSPPPPRTLVAPAAVEERESTGPCIEDPVAARAVALISENLSDKLTNDLIASWVGVSRSVLQGRFRKAMGVSIRDHIIERRMERAVGLLEETQLTFADIAERAGYRHPEYMATVFKNRLGKSPQDVKREAAAKRSSTSV